MGRKDGSRVGPASRHNPLIQLGAILQGIKIVDDLGNIHVKIEYDQLEAVNLIMSENSSMHEFDVIIDNICQFLNRKYTLKIMHILREVNQCAYDGRLWLFSNVHLEKSAFIYFCASVSGLHFYNVYQNLVLLFFCCVFSAVPKKYTCTQSYHYGTNSFSVFHWFHEELHLFDVPSLELGLTSSISVWACVWSCMCFFPACGLGIKFGKAMIRTACKPHM